MKILCKGFFRGMPGRGRREAEFAEIKRGPLSRPSLSIHYAFRSRMAFRMHNQDNIFPAAGKYFFVNNISGSGFCGGPSSVAECVFGGRVSLFPRPCPLHTSKYNIPNPSLYDFSRYYRSVFSHNFDNKHI